MLFRSIEEFRIASGGSRFVWNGRIAPPAAEADAWRFDISAAPGAVLAPSEPSQPEIKFDVLRLTGRLSPAERRLEIEKIEARGPQTNAMASFAFEAEPRRLRPARFRPHPPLALPGARGTSP